ncbi:hypothetical protein GCM10027446_03090 [Angustibacter peucedani]
MTTTRPDVVPPHRLTVLAPDGARLATWVSEPPPSAPGSAPSAPPVTVVLAHGWTLTHDAWASVLPLVQAQTAVRLVTYDQRGHGSSSSGRRHRPSVRALGDDLAAVVEAVAPTGPLVLGGHSMGGMTVMAFAGTHAAAVRERVRGVLLVSTSAGELNRGRPRGETLMMRAISRVPGLRAGRAITSSGQRALLFGLDANPADVDATRTMVRGTRLRTIGGYYAALGRHDEAEALAHLADVPTRVVVGSLDRLTPVEHARRLAELVPHARLDVRPGKGHMLGFEAPQVVADHLVALVEEAA